MRTRGYLISLLIVLILLVAADAAYRLIVPGLSSARNVPPGVEVAVATWLLHQSVPEADKASPNPLGADRADTAAGQELYRQKCEICHAYDGSGKTNIGAGQYPRPPALRSADVMSMPDGELFYHIRNGIRNTGMPAWQMPDRETWQLVTYIRDLPKIAAMEPAAALAAPSAAADSRRYVGSSACKNCHLSTFDHWSKSLMANVVRDPKEHPDAITPDLAKPDPLLTFSKDDVAFVYGTRWKQRYFKKVGNDYFPLPAQWDVAHKIWRPYFVPANADWWVPHYPPDNFKRPTGPLCDGCHSVNYDIASQIPAEWNVGCEKCHGPGSEHVARATRDNILNPARFDYVNASDTCIQCHSQGQPLTNPIQGKYYDWPVGFNVGLKLADYWKLEEHKVGETTFTHFPDGTGHKNRMQGNDFVESLMYARGVTCFNCHDPHGNENPGMVRKVGNGLCLDCHGPNSQNGPHAATIEQHTHHLSGSAGGECIACHMPKIEQTIADQNVRSHTFHFVTPAQTDALKIPNACNVCHMDQTTGWATAALLTWKDRSPWRMQ
jgi:predicted CXXCH cytochrome family protein